MLYARSISRLILFLSVLTFGCTSSENAENPPSSITLQELETGSCNPVLFENKNSGHTGSGYINTPNAKAARVTWSIESPDGGEYTLEIRYANGGTTARSGELFVNEGTNGTFDVALPPAGDWTEWRTALLDVDLVPGENLLVLRAVSDDGLANIDSLKVTGVNPSPGNCGEPKPSSNADVPVDFSYLGDPPVGWATQGNGITGGGDLPPIIVTSMDELQFHAAGAQPKVIQVDGQLEGMLTVGSNKTIVGLQGARISSDAGVLRLTDSQNVIIKNLELVGVHERNQSNSVLHNVENVWLDHNSFINGSPDLLLLSGTSDLVTISWNVFRHTMFGHEHMGVNIGLADSATESIGHMNVTLHHNHYAKLVNERMPRVRFGKVHTFNNLCVAGTDELTRSYYAVRAGFDANVRSERNMYRDFNGPSWWWTSERFGAENATVFNYARGNENSVLESIEDVCTPDCVGGPIDVREHQGVTGKAGFYSTGRAFVPPYSYSADPTDGLEARIRAGAGAR